MDLYRKIINDKEVIRHRSLIVVVKDGLQTICPSHEQLIEDGWELYVTPEYVPTEEELLNKAKNEKIEEIKFYDSSERVNRFSVSGMSMWLDKATRAGLKLRLEAEQAMGQQTTTLWNNGVSFQLQLEDAFMMLYALEVYASRCYDNTQRHIGEVMKLSTIEEVASYDYTVGYPTMLEF